MKVLPVFFVLLLASASWAVDVKKLNVSVSLSQVSGSAGNTSTFSWGLDTELQQPNKNFLTNFTLDSDYSKSGSSKVDHLLLALRFIDPRYESITSDRWLPMFIVQNEGDHSFEQGNLLIAAGLRKKHKVGIYEITLGTSNDRGDGDGWMTDLGLRITYDRKWGRLRLTAGPQGQVVSDATARLTGDKFRYSYDVNLSYMIDKHMGIGLRGWQGNTVPGSDHSLWVGLTFTQ